MIKVIVHPVFYLFILFNFPPKWYVGLLRCYPRLTVLAVHITLPTARIITLFKISFFFHFNFIGPTSSLRGRRGNLEICSSHIQSCAEQMPENKQLISGIIPSVKQERKHGTKVAILDSTNTAHLLPALFRYIELKFTSVFHYPNVEYQRDKQITLAALF